MERWLRDQARQLRQDGYDKQAFPLEQLANNLRAGQSISLRDLWGRSGSSSLSKLL
jgi:hypothetical protein